MIDLSLEESFVEYVTPQGGASVVRAWRALLWKESREELPKVLVGLGLCAVVVALRQNAEFNEEFARKLR